MTRSVGDVVWVPRVGMHRVEAVCPICFGKKRAIVILGDDSKVSVECDNCGCGYDGPRGVVTEYINEAIAESFAIVAVQSETTSDGEQIGYITHGGRHARDNECFSSQEEAQAVAEKMNRDQIAEDESRADRIKKDSLKKFSWNAGYHRREAKRLREQAEVHDRKAVLCAARGKDKEVQP